MVPRAQARTMSAASASSTDLTRQKTRFENTTTPPVTAQSLHSKGAAKTARRPTASPSGLVSPVEDDGSLVARLPSAGRE